MLYYFILFFPIKGFSLVLVFSFGGELGGCRVIGGGEGCGGFE